MAFKFSRGVTDKLEKKHHVTAKEVMECFANGEAIYFTDNREEHRTDPPTQWFMAPTNRRRILKVCFMRIDDDIVIKTAFEPDTSVHLDLYRKLADLPDGWPEEE